LFKYFLKQNFAVSLRIYPLSYYTDQ